MQRLAVRKDVRFRELVKSVDQELHDEHRQEDRGDLEEQREVDAVAVTRPQHRHDGRGERAVLGLATGSTPIGIYRELIRMHREEGLDFSNVITFNLDEYYPMAPDSIHSYHRYMWENLFEHINIKKGNVHIPRGDIPRDQVERHCAEYEKAIREAGGIDYQILGIGKTGHIGFNEPGSGIESRTRLVALDTITRRDAAADFFGEENVPIEAITARLDPDVCVPCKVCASVCPYHAIEEGDPKTKKLPVFVEASCAGCGTCCGCRSARRSPCWSCSCW